MKFLDNLSDFVTDLFANDWAVLLLGLGGTAVLFAACLAFSLFLGDFARNKKALKIICKGRTEDGLKRLKGAPDFDKSLFIAPQTAAFDYGKIVLNPYSYSVLKRLPAVSMAASAFFTAASVSAATINAGGFGGFALVMLILSPALGLILFVSSVLIAAKSLKNADSLYHKTLDTLKDVSVSVSGEVVDDQPLPEAVQNICKRIEVLAVEGGADYGDLSGLYLEIESQKQRTDSPKALAKLDAALEVLKVLVDSAIS